MGIAFSSDDMFEDPPRDPKPVDLRIKEMQSIIGLQRTMIDMLERDRDDYKKAGYEDRKRLIRTLDFLRDLAGTGQIDLRIVLLTQAYAEGQDLFEAECSKCRCVTKAWTTRSFYEAGVIVNQVAVCYSCDNAW